MLSFESRGTVQQKLIEAGVRNLKEFGYENVSKENILVDVVYSMFFLSMLEDNKGLGFDFEIEGLINEIKENENAL